MKTMLRLAVLFILAFLTVAAFADTPSPPPSPWGDLSVLNDATIKGPHSLPNPGDGIFVPHLRQIAKIDTTAPFTVFAPMEEPAFASIVAANKPTGDSYIIKFTTNQAGGACVFDGNARYFIESTGVLTYEISAACGNLRRGYTFMVCMLDGELRCSQAPWWNFQAGTYAVSAQGVTVNGAKLYAWDKPEAMAMAQKIAARQKEFKDKYNNPSAPNVLHRRFISCRHYEPEQKKYSIAEIMTGCVISSLCNADKSPDLSAMRDGDVIDWNSPAGKYVVQQEKITDTSKWVCWPRSQ